VHVRLARVPARRRLTRDRHVRLIRFLPLAVALAGCVAACGRTAPAAEVRVEWTLTPTPPAVGPAILVVRCVDFAGEPVRGASLKVEGHMTHPGMTPVLADFVEREAGVYHAAFEFTMSGDWILLVSGTVASGGAVRDRIEVANVRPAA